MQKAKYTPGPWKYEPQDGRKNQRIEQFQEVIDELGKKIATISTTVWRQHHGPSAVANARLIAAAPELLEALLPFAEPHAMGDSYVQFAPRLLEAARAAIAKATAEGGAA